MISRVVIDPDTAIQIAVGELALPPDLSVVVPTLLRSQVLAALYDRVRNGDLTKDEGLSINARFAELKFRYLGDAVLRRRAWTIADRLGLESTELAEYIALAQLQADALATADKKLSEAALGEVKLVSPSSLGLAHGDQPNAR